MMNYRIFLIAFIALLMAGCKTTSVRVLPPTSVEPYFDSKLMENCKRPIKIPERALAQMEVEEYWMIDRKNLIVCGDKHKALADSIKFRGSGA
jgi:hypothetical protein